MSFYFVQVMWDGGGLYGNTIASEFSYDTAPEAFEAIKRIVKDPTMEGDSIRALSIDGEFLFRSRKMKGLTFGAHDWPFAPSPTFKGEITLSCPCCGSTNWTMGGQHAVRGTGPSGRGRMGDPGGVDILRCNDCKFESRKNT